MRIQKVRFERSVVYGGFISLGLFALLAGDGLRSMPVPALPNLSATVAASPGDWELLAKAISKRATHFSGQVGYIIKDLKSGRVATYNANSIFPSASLIKFPIMCAAFLAMEEGHFSLSTPITLQRGDRRGGSGVLK